MKRKRLLPDPYGAEIWFLYGPAAEIDSYLRRKHGGKNHIANDEAATFCTFPGSYPVHYISLARDRVRGKVSYAGCLAHECTHAAFEVFNSRGIVCDNGHDEPFAYYHEWLFRQCLRAVW